MSKELKSYNQVKQEIAINEVAIRSMSDILKIYTSNVHWCKTPLLLYVIGFCVIGGIYGNIPMIVTGFILCIVGVVWLQATGLLFKCNSIVIHNAENVKREWTND